MKLEKSHRAEKHPSALEETFLTSKSQKRQVFPFGENWNFFKSHKVSNKPGPAQVGAISKAQK